MTVGQMIDGFKTIELLEKDLMRDLTEEEKKVVLVDGWKKFLFDSEHLNFSEDDYKELRALKAIISAFYTEDEEVFNRAIKNSPKSVYFVLKHIAKVFEDNEPCENPECKKIQEIHKDSFAEFEKFMAELINSIPKADVDWFDRLTDDDCKRLFEEVYKVNRNESQDCSDDILGGLITDAVKDAVISNMVKELKEGKTVHMTNDEYLEVADFLCEHENRVFISNSNGDVKLALFK